MRTQQLVFGGLLGLASAQFPPKREGVKWLKSRFHEKVTISYKEPEICETTPGVKSYSGYVHLPPGLLDDGSGEAQNYPINTFFWFFEARSDPANSPLAIWLNGGPGGSSMMGLLEGKVLQGNQWRQQNDRSRLSDFISSVENGPCRIANDSKTTYLNPWSWNNEVNMLYLDQPNQVGFSYDVPTNGTWELDDEGGFFVVPANFTDDGPLPETNLTSHYGTFASQDLAQTANSTAHAAHALWHFAQTWFFEFPHYKPADGRVSLWTESYGGHYGPGIMNFFQQQNEKIANGSSEEQGAHYIHLDTLGIINGLLDMAVQGESNIQFAYNNTYGIEAFNQSIYDELMHIWTKPDGCQQRVSDCQAALKKKKKKRDDPATEEEACRGVEDDCWVRTIRRYYAEDRGFYDIAHPLRDPFPPPHLYGYLASAPVLAALGVPVNYSEHSAAVSSDFSRTYDMLRGGFLEAAGALLDAGVKVHMVYGDRDYACNWVGGERASLAVPHRRAAEFAGAGYEAMLAASPDYVPASHLSLGRDKDEKEQVVAGMTRQVGHFSFTRVFQAGHEVPSYQPAAAYAVFLRAMFDRDIATGRRRVTDDLVTEGPADTWHIKNVAPAWPVPRCYILKPATCTTEVWDKVKKGQVVVKDYYVVDILDDNDDEKEGEEEESGLGFPVDEREESQEVMGEL
ncbi:serine carboxypeptidase [Apiospora phragmitis]|uniref:Serine carboxypeptidase n=1 Tax=Apiospora phragmitis TaxID=2905665 RepID=A0ABR1WS78_9PEZI